MPYSPEHKRNTRAKIVESARILFNRHGFNTVTIDMVMAGAGLTRGGFYKHFSSKEELYAAAVSGFLMGRGAQWRCKAGIDLTNLKPEMAQQMLETYLSTEHLADTEGQCPMIALPSDVARAGPEVQASYQKLLEAMIWLFERGVEEQSPQPHKKALSLAAITVGGMVLARTLPGSELADEVRLAALDTATQMMKAG